MKLPAFVSRIGQWSGKAAKESWRLCREISFFDVYMAFWPFVCGAGFIVDLRGRSYLGAGALLVAVFATLLNKLVVDRMKRRVYIARAQERAWKEASQFLRDVFSDITVRQTTARNTPPDFRRMDS